MKNVLSFLLIVFWLTGACIAEESSTAVARELSDIFNTAASTLEAPKPKVKPVVSPEAPAGGRELTVMAYSYCLRGRTASGLYTKHGIIAVDPRVIPLGSRVHVPGYGWAIAADTGGMIVGNKIDLWKPTAADCYAWGVRRVKIKVFPPQK